LGPAGLGQRWLFTNQGTLLLPLIAKAKEKSYQGKGLFFFPLIAKAKEKREKTKNKKKSPFF
jgi:hypothetical protein